MVPESQEYFTFLPWTPFSHTCDTIIAAVSLTTPSMKAHTQRGTRNELIHREQMFNDTDALGFTIFRVH